MHKVNPHTKLCFGIIILCLNIVTTITLFSNIANADSASSVSSTASVTVPEACTMTSTTNTPHTATLSPNTYSGASGSEYANGIGKTTLTATCNDDNGFAIYAIGYTGNSYDSENHNKLVGQSTNVAINTAVYTSGDTTSSWSMKVNKINDSTVSYNPQNMSILDSFDSWHIVPDTYTKVAQYKASTGSSTTDTTLGAKVETTYAAFIAQNQPADTYVGQVKYTMVHPYMAVAGKLNVTYDGNGLSFANSKTTNLVSYDAISNFKISRSSYTDEGEYGGYTTPGGNNVVTIPNTENLHIKVTYGVPQGTGGPPSDLYIWTGNHPDYTNANNATSIASCGMTNTTDGSFKSSGSSGSQVTMECDIVGDSVTFYDYGQYNVSTGYYAVVSKQGQELYAKTIVSGEYMNPNTEDGNYEFLGWNTNPNATESTYDTESEFLNSPFINADGHIVLYAIHRKTINGHLAGAGKTKYNNYYRIQDMDSSICSKIPENLIGELIDERDNEIYKVTKLHDGNCWMLENLRLDPTNSTTSAKMDESNTNASWAAIDNYIHGGNPNSISGWSSSAVRNITDIVGSYDAYVLPIIYNQDKNKLVNGFGAASNQSQAKVGIYYTYCAATIGTYCYEVDVSGDTDNRHDVCPANWRMPIGSEYQDLILQYEKEATSQDSLQFNLSTPLSGLGNSGQSHFQNERGLFWSATSMDSVTMRILYVTEYYTSVDGYGRHYAFPIRCMVK